MPKGPIIDYIVVRDNEADQFGLKVMELINKGYRCRGKMRKQRADYLQNMVKRGPRPS